MFIDFIIMIMQVMKNIVKMRKDTGIGKKKQSRDKYTNPYKMCT